MFHQHVSNYDESDVNIANLLLIIPLFKDLQVHIQCDSGDSVFLFTHVVQEFSLYDVNDEDDDNFDATSATIYTADDEERINFPDMIHRVAKSTFNSKSVPLARMQLTQFDDSITEFSTFWFGDDESPLANVIWLKRKKPSQKKEIQLVENIIKEVNEFLRYWKYDYNRSGGSVKKMIKNNKNAIRRVYIDKVTKKAYVVVNKAKVLLSAIKGKYRYVDGGLGTREFVIVKGLIV